MPNVVIIFTDDQGYADVGCFGAEGFKTPHLDKLAAGGMRFTHFYASQAVCSASRGSLMTGCYAERVSVQGALTSGARTGLNPEEVTIAEMLKQKGYATAIFGKWHLGHDSLFLPLNQGFDEYFGLPYSNDMWPVGYDGLPDTGMKGKAYPPLPLIEGNGKIGEIKTLEDQAMLTTLYTERAVEYIEKNHEEPFLLYLAHSMPHVPLGVSRKFKGISEQGAYGDVIMEIDWSVGEIMKALENHGLINNTLVIFTSDNGPWMNYGNHAGSAYPLREGKGTTWEGGPLVPCIMHWPEKIPQGFTCDKMASTIDILPTLASIVDVPVPERKTDGVNILPLMMNDPEANPRNTFYYYYGRELRAVRKDNWKLCFPHDYRSYKGVEPGRDGYPGSYTKASCDLELYNLTDDIGETRNVIDKYPEIVAELQEIAEQARAELGDGLQKRSGGEVRPPGRLRPSNDMFVEHRGKNGLVEVIPEPHPYYAGDGGNTLVNGIMGSYDFKDGEWLGYWGDDFEVIVDLGEPVLVNEIKVNFLSEQGAWIFLPSKVSALFSDDGETFTKENTISHLIQKNSDPGVKSFQFNPGLMTRFIKVSVKNTGLCPEWHPAEGEDAWVFIDEVIVN